MRSLLLIFIVISTLFAKKHVTLQLPWFSQFQFAGYYIAKHKGFYDEVGLDVDIKDISSGISPTDSVKNNIAQYGVSRTSVILEIIKGEPLVLMLAAYQTSPMMLLVRQDSGIKSAQDLRYKRIMIPDDATNSIEIRAMLNSAGLSKDNLIIQKPSYDFISLANNQTDAMLCYTSNEPYSLEKYGIATTQIHPKDYGFDYYSDILFTSKDELKNHPKRLEAFYNASMRGWLWAFDNIHEAATIMYKYYNPHNKSMDELIYEAKVLKELAFNERGVFGEISPKKIGAIAQTYKLLDNLNNIPSLDGFIYKSDNIFLNDIEKEYLKKHKILRVAIDKNWPPIEGVYTDGEIFGISSTYVKYIEKKLGIKIEFDVSSSTKSQILQKLKSNSVDIVSSLVVDKVNNNDFLVSKPISKQSLIIVTKSDRGYINDINDLRGKTIAVAKHYGAQEILKTLFKDVNILAVDTPLEALKAVSSNEAFAAIESAGVTGYLKEKYNLDNIKVAGDTPFTIDIAFGVNKDNEVLLSIINKALLSIDTSEYETMHNQWINIKQDKIADYKIAVIVGVLFLVLFVFMIYKNRRLDIIIRQRTRELEDLNQRLQDEIDLAVEKNRAQEKLLMQQSKMAEIGSLLESIAHQWRQPLNILGLSMMRLNLMFGLDPKSDTAKMLHIAETQIQYMSQTIDDFRSFFKQDRSKVPTNIYDLIHDVLSLLGPLMAQKKIQIDTNIARDMEVVVYPNELKQVLINIINNSREAINGSHNEQKLISIRCESIDDKYLISIEDTGGGIKADIIDKIFDPYFTTKFESQGTGIGLYMSKIIIEKHFNGKLIAKNTKKGARFEIILNKNQEDVNG